MPKDRRKIPHHYSVVVKSFGPAGHKLWSWEIRRVPELGVKLYGRDFPSELEAKLAGEKALQDLLNRLPDEERDA
jgi:hypothetical protein